MSCLCFGCSGWFPWQGGGGVGIGGCIRGWVVPRAWQSHPKTQRWLLTPRIRHLLPALSASFSGKRKVG